jgi:hypothetical protein
VGDGNSYIAKMLQGQSGAWLFQTPYSSQDSPGILAFFPYFFGKQPPVGTAQSSFSPQARLALIPLAVYDLSILVALFPDAWARATVLAAAGGGLGWLLTLSGNSKCWEPALDFYSPESWFPGRLWPAARSLGEAPALFVDGLLDLRRTRPGLIAGVSCWARRVGAGSRLGLHCDRAHLLHFGLKIAGPTEDVGLGSSAALAIVVSLPLVLYYVFGSLSVPALQQWASQNILPSPHPIHYLLAYALVLVPAFLGARDLVRTDAVLGWFLASWLIVLFVLAYAPLTVQRRLIEGAWVVLSSRGAGAADGF